MRKNITNIIKYCEIIMNMCCYSNEKFTVSFVIVSYVIQVQHPDKQIVDECIDVFLNISSNILTRKTKTSKIVK